jgi:hypothetical protein
MPGTPQGSANERFYIGCSPMTTALIAAKAHLDSHKQWHTAVEVASAIKRPIPETRVLLRTLCERKEAKCYERAGMAAQYCSIFFESELATPASGRPATAPAPVQKTSVSLSIAELLADAKAENERNTYGPATPYVEIIHELRTKRFSFKEIHGWLKAKNIALTVSGIQSTYKKWLSSRNGTPAKKAKAA